MAAGRAVGVRDLPGARRDVPRAGWSKQRLREFMFEAVRKPAGELRRGETTPLVHAADPAAEVHKWASPEAIVLLVAGGEAGRYSAVLGPCTGMGSQIVSREVGSAVTTDYVSPFDERVRAPEPLAPRPAGIAGRSRGAARHQEEPGRGVSRPDRVAADGGRSGHDPLDQGDLLQARRAGPDREIAAAPTWWSRHWPIEARVRRAVCATSFTWSAGAIPAVGIATTPFADEAIEQARLLAMPGCRMLYIPHPVQLLTAAELDARADAVVPAVVAALTAAARATRPRLTRGSNGAVPDVDGDGCPSTGITAPLTYDAASESSQAITAATSSAWAGLRCGTSAVTSS